MLTLSADFQNRLDNNDTRRLVLAHLYYDETNYLPISTVATVVDGVQYTPALKDMVGSSMSWDLLGKNNITVSMPKLRIINYNTPDGYSIIDELNQQNYIGRKVVIFLGYEGQLLQDMLTVFDGITEDIDYKNGYIEIKGKTFTIPESNIQGRKIDFTKQLLGDYPLPDGFDIVKENDGRFLPICFGNHWCAPGIPYMQSRGYQTAGGTSVDRYYAFHDSKYYPFLKHPQIQDHYHFNLNRTEPLLMLLNDEYYTPFYKQDWYADSFITYDIEDYTGEYGFKIFGPRSSYHTKTSDGLFVITPLRYQTGDYTNPLTVSGASAYDPYSKLDDVFSNDVLSPYTITHILNEPLKFWAKCKLDMEFNLRGDEVGYIRNRRRIHVPATDEDNGQGYLMGKASMDIGYIGFYNGYLWVEENIYPLNMNHWSGGFVGELDDDSKNQDNYMDAGYSIQIHHDQMPHPPYTYDMNARVFAKSTSYHYADFANDLDNIGCQGLVNPTPQQGRTPFLNRDSFNGPIGAALEIHILPEITSPGCTETVTIDKLFHANMGNIEFKKDSNAYTMLKGASVDGGVLSSVPTATMDYMLHRPYEYIELLLRAKGNQTLFGSSFDFDDIYWKWNNLFGFDRDGSGFAITEEMTLDKFMEEYLQYEPYSIYADETGAWNIKVLKPQYDEGDIDGYLDYADATSLNIGMTQSKNIALEIDHIKTDYMYDIDEYVNDFHYRLKDFDFGFWNIRNNQENNEFKLENIEKKYTSYVPVHTVKYNGKSYGCIRINIGIAPDDTDGQYYWSELNQNNSVNNWSSTTRYLGEDAEVHSLAKIILNLRANRHRTLTFETKNLEYLKYSLGDIVGFQNVPFSLLGQNIKGFKGATNFTATLNGQTVYGAFIITSIRKSLSSIQIECMQPT